MDITYNVPHVFYPGSSQDENADALRILLDGLIRLNESYLRHHSCPHLYRSGVVYGRTDIWDSIPSLYERKFGDCKSLTAALIAWYRIVVNDGREYRPVFRFQTTNSGGMLYHILVQISDPKTGKVIFEDPSKTLGMEAYEAKYSARDRTR